MCTLGDGRFRKYGDDVVNRVVVLFTSTLTGQYCAQAGVQESLSYSTNTSYSNSKMDITMLPPSNILSNHSHHLYHQLLPSALPRTSHTCGIPTEYTLRHPRNTYFEPAPPYDGSSPLADLPDELVLEIFKYLNWKELLPLQRSCLRFKDLAQSGSLYHHLTLTTLPPYPLPSGLVRILPNVKHLHLHLLPYPSTASSATRTILALLDHISPDQLVSLSLPFSAPYLSATELGKLISRIGGKLEKLDLRGSGLAGKGWLDWIGRVGENGRGLRELDLGFTNITELPALSSSPSNPSSPAIGQPTPRPPISPFRNLTTLSLASCTSLSPSAIYTFLSTLPPSLESLDISRLEQTSYEALRNMNVAQTGLKEIKVIGIDHLTRLDIRKLRYHWESQRRPATGFEDDQVEIARVWGEPRTPNLTISSPPRTPDSLPLLSSSLGSSSSSGPSSLISNSSRLHESTSPRLLTPENPINDLPKMTFERKHPFLADLKGPPSIPNYSPITPQDEKESLEEISININIIHSAILESEDEAGYRQFIGEVAGGTVGLGLGHGYGLGMRWINQ
jgi:hypothetical protein